MKRCVFLFVPLLLLLTACARPADQSHATVEYSYAEDLTTLEDVLRHSTNIVRAKLESAQDFDGAVQVYLFRVTNDLTGNTPDEIHVYDAYDPAYILGHSYYLFLCSGESALYPPHHLHHRGQGIDSGCRCSGGRHRSGQPRHGCPSV